MHQLDHRQARQRHEQVIRGGDVDRACHGPVEARRTEDDVCDEDPERPSRIRVGASGRHSKKDQSQREKDGFPEECQLSPHARVERVEVVEAAGDECTEDQVRDLQQPKAQAQDSGADPAVDRGPCGLSSLVGSASCGPRTDRSGNRRSNIDRRRRRPIGARCELSWHQHAGGVYPVSESAVPENREVRGPDADARRMPNPLRSTPPPTFRSTTRVVARG